MSKTKLFDKNTILLRKKLRKLVFILTYEFRDGTIFGMT